jgi:phage repressor protein C with HTH and peptisase S24 domain
MTGIGDRVRQIRESKTPKWSRKYLSQLTGISETAISDLELGRSKRSLSLHKLADALGVTATWLETGRGPREKSAVPTDDLFTEVTAFAASVGLSDGEEAHEYATTHGLKFRTDTLREKGLLGANLAVLYGKGDSMSPLIETGDAVLFDLGDTTPRHECLYVVQLPGVSVHNQISVKRAELIGDIVTFRALNPAGDHNWRKPRLMNDPRNPITVVGRVRWIGKWL